VGNEPHQQHRDEDPDLNLLSKNSACLKLGLSRNGTERAVIRKSRYFEEQIIIGILSLRPGHYSNNLAIPVSADSLCISSSGKILSRCTGGRSLSASHWL
jgi:hypothetical protein